MDIIQKNIQNFIFIYYCEEKNVSDISKDHIRIHTGEWLYKCYIAGEISIENSKLYYHFGVHGGEMYYRE